MLQMVHPDRVVDEAGLAQAAAGRAGLSADRRAWTPSQLRKAIDGALERLPALPEWQDASLAGARADSRLSPRRCAHCIVRPSRPMWSPKRRPGRASPMTNCSPANWRSRWCARICAGRPAARMPATADCARRSSPPCPIRSPPSQQRALDEIAADLAKPERMLRLLQGDVGSGKTVVALLACRGGDRGRPAGRADGADRNPGAPASQDHRAVGGGGRHPRRDPHRPRTRPRARDMLERLAAGEIDF